MQLAGKIALVTGGSRGIGRGISLALAEAGADLIVHYVRHADAAREVVAAAQQHGRRAVATQADLADSAAARRMVEESLAACGRIDILVCNAGSHRRTPFLEIGDDEWDWVLDLDLKAPFVVGQAVARSMIERGIAGRIVNIASISATEALPELTHYQCAKAGVWMLTRGMALELAPHGITVNSVSPGLTRTDLTRRVTGDPDALGRRLSRIPLGRLGEPADIAGAVVFLASDAAGWITGSNILVDGGTSVLQ
ncbi:MAG: glucose 1-dehydrogenase [Chloroflexi bacterium]|nr:glucose 1-dehydrogenase [Chloroflexota bacterium]